MPTSRTAPPTRTAALAVALALPLMATGVLGVGGVLAGPAGATPSTSAVVSEVYGGGGNTGATLKNDFVELHGAGTAPVELSGWSVQYLPAVPGPTSTWQVTPLSGSVAADGSYLVAEAAGTGGTTGLPAADASGSINMSGTAGTVALVRTTAALTCKTAADCAADTDILDLVGWGGAAVHETTAAPATTSATSVQRTDPAVDTDDNSADFTVATPTPTGSGATPTPGDVRIHDIQGDGFLSTHAGDAVTNVPGIVTAVRTTSSKGFWLQDPDPDNDPATSEGVFVFTGSTPTVTAGDSVLVSGTVSEYPSRTDASVSTLSVTEIGTPTVQVVSSGNPLPAPVVITATTVPDIYAPDLGGGTIESTPIEPARSALDWYESVEGMRVEVDDTRVVGPSNTYGEQYVTTKPAQAVTYRGGTELLGENQTPSGRLEVVTLDGSDPAVDVGDVLQGATVGPLDYSSFGGYELVASTLGTVQHNALPPTAATSAPGRQLSVATYNVENLAPGDPAAKYAALGSGVVTRLGSPDVVALEEIQDNSGATDDGTVVADQTLAELVAAIKAAGGPTYKWRSIDPVNDQDGGQPGGNIRVAFLFNQKRVSFVDTGAGDVNRSTIGTAVTGSGTGTSLTLSPGRIDPTNPVWTSSRKPLVGEFRFRGQPVFVIANHFDSKGGDQDADGRYQYPLQSSATQRAGQALVVHDFVQRLLAADAAAAVLVVGDLNDYQFSPALATLRTGTADGTGPSILTDLITTLPTDQQYTYVFDGVSQVLDHILTTAAVRVRTYQVVHVNAEYHDQVSDHDPQVVDVQV